MLSARPMDAPLQMSLARFLLNIVAKTMRLRQIRQERMMSARTAAHAQNPASLRSTARCSSCRVDPSKEATIFSLFVVSGSRMNYRSTLSCCFTNLDAGSKKRVRRSLKVSQVRYVHSIKCVQNALFYLPCGVESPKLLVWIGRNVVASKAFWT